MAACAVALAGVVTAAAFPDLRTRLVLEAHLATASPQDLQDEADGLAREVARLRQTVAEMRGAAQGRRPSLDYIVVDTRANRLLLRTADQVQLDAVCSTGSGEELVVSGRSWVFNTPRGVFRVRAKVRSPVWTKPDWAFYEEGKKPPSARSRERLEEGVLGDYALALGDGYLIHGTLYKRTLGKNVTHGCVRLDDDALAALYQAVTVGTPVHIF